MKKIPLPYGKFALIDTEDWDELSQYNWSLDSGGFPQRRARPGEHPQTIRMHRQVMGYPQNREVDHIDRNRLNCQKSNLRLATRSQNQANCGPRKNNTLGYVGISKTDKKWTAACKKNYRRYVAGRFLTKEEAAKAYDKLARELHGKFAYQNFPNELR